MQFTTTTILALAALTTSALSAPTSAVSMMATGTTWTIQSFKRTCTAASSTAANSCTYSYSINTHVGTATPCSYKVSGSPAERASYTNLKCGTFAVSSSWSGQFGEGNGFQTLAVVKGSQIIYPGYTDKQLVSGKVVTPDQSYTPQSLPK